MLQALLHDQTLQLVIVAMVVLALADLVTGIVAAIRSGTFDAGFLSAWIGEHLLPVFLTVGTILASAVLNEALVSFPDADATLRTTLQASAAAAYVAGLASFATYALTTLKSLQGNLNAFATKTKGAPKTIALNVIGTVASTRTRPKP